MIVSNIIGGLGNQMFQYAAGRALALKIGVDFKVDLRDFDGYKLHQGFELDRLFSCTVKVASNKDLNNVLGWQSSQILQRFLRRLELKTLRKDSFIVEPHFNYWRGINQLNDNKYLYGYWQSEKYFIEYAENIREDFAFKLPFSPQNAEIAEQITQVNAVSLHVRRGDYVTNKKNSYIGICSLDYYKKAINHINCLVNKPIFFIFSDDIEWVKNNLVLDKSTIFINHNKGVESYNDMRLMSLCKHNIIANSSFSWWGAWLNSKSQKIVIAPKQWFASGKDDIDLIPSSWLRL